MTRLIAVILAMAGILGVGVWLLMGCVPKHIPPPYDAQLVKDSVALSCKMSGGEMFGNDSGRTWCSYNGK